MNIDSREGFGPEEEEAYNAWCDESHGFDAWANDVDADADTLASAGWGTDEDYNYDMEYDWE